MITSGMKKLKTTHTHTHTHSERTETKQNKKSVLHLTHQDICIKCTCCIFTHTPQTYMHTYSINHIAVPKHSLLGWVNAPIQWWSSRTSNYIWTSCQPCRVALYDLTRSCITQMHISKLPIVKPFLKSNLDHNGYISGQIFNNMKKRNGQK